MQLNDISPKKALNKTYRKQAVSEQALTDFKIALHNYILQIKEAEKLKQTEGGMGDRMLSFLNICLPEYHISKKSIKGQHEMDLAIRNGNKASDEVGVIIEQKRPGENDMISPKNVNTKAMHEAVTYFLHERLNKENANPNVRNVVICDFYNWYIFDASDFFKAFDNPSLLKNFKNWRDKKTIDNSTQGIYNIIKNYIDSSNKPLCATYVNLLDYAEGSGKSEADFIRLYKLFSDVHLLKKPFENDANSLNKKFYDELLYLIGLEEVKVKNKKLIQRLNPEKRQHASLLESAIDELSALGILHEMGDLKNYGENEDEQLFALGLELCITWINRVLFLKLLEGQLLRYHQGHEQYAFLHPTKVKEYDDLQTLFFKILAVKPDDRNERFKQAYQHIPYLNSSLFERSPLERVSITIANLEDRLRLPLHKKSVLRKSEPPNDALNYLLRFLNAYDFGLEGKETKLAEQNKPLINASVLGLIFEKINGYKEGSFYTPSFITMYMCRQTIRRAVCDKLGALYGLEFGDFDELRRYMDRNVLKKDDLETAEKVIDGLTICDPAVGSGHFLVSALNELIATKAELGLLLNEQGEPLRVEVSVQNDELIVEDDRHGDFFDYLPTRGEAGGPMHNLQKTLFLQKQRIIENCLFGVDINPNSVKICRLRLWIELLKHTYYMDAGDDDTRPEDAFMYLKTLPNIDINIKCGNSLISRFALDSDLSEALKDTKYSIETYKDMISTYHHVKDGQSKKEIERALLEIKETFKGEIDKRDPRLKGIKTRQSKLFKLGGLKQGGGLFDAMEAVSKGEQKKRQAQIKKLGKEIGDLETSIEADKNAVIYNNAFEWRYEFPKVLDDDGQFMGFDVVIGNPPYGVSIKGKSREQITKSLGKVPDYEIYYWFINLGYNLLTNRGKLNYIIPNTILFNVNAQKYRLNLLQKWELYEILDCTNFSLFEEATVRNIIFNSTKVNSSVTFGYRNPTRCKTINELIDKQFMVDDKSKLLSNKTNWGLVFKLKPSVLNLIGKLKQESNQLHEIFPETSQGLIAYDKYRGQNEDTIKNRVFHSFKKKSDNHKEWLYGSDVKRYDIKWNGKEYVNYCDRLANPRKPEFFRGKRLLIREITNPSIFGVITYNEFYHDPAIIVIKDSNSFFSLELLLGIFNSKIATFFHFNSSPKATKGAFPKILVTDINNFPLPSISPPKQEVIEALVKERLNLKKESSQADTQALEDEIDLYVYKLYGLTHEEVLIVDPDFVMSEGDYEAVVF